MLTENRAENKAKRSSLRASAFHWKYCPSPLLHCPFPLFRRLPQRLSSDRSDHRRVNFRRRHEFKGESSGLSSSLLNCAYFAGVSAVLLRSEYVRLTHRSNHLLRTLQLPIQILRRCRNRPSPPQLEWVSEPVDRSDQKLRITMSRRSISASALIPFPGKPALIVLRPLELR